jgi:hypothetical protein
VAIQNLFMKKEKEEVLKKMNEQVSEIFKTMGTPMLAWKEEK